MSEHVEGSVSFEVSDFVATVTLNRPTKLNAMTPMMAAQVVEYMKRCNEDDAIRAVVLTGAGPKSFCAGSDIGTLDDYTTPWNFRNRPDYCDAVRGLLKPSIAAINGYAFGGGLETSLSCDIRIASANAQFAAPEIKLGWIGGGGMAAFLANSIGASNAALMLMTGDPIDAERALQWGLISEVVESAEQVLPRAQDVARTIAQRAPIAAETAKSNLHAAFNMPLENAIQYERDLQTICFATDDAREGRAAFKEKRQPVFSRK
ncbi:enoyl-CoA hydratase/isomerase family protein [Paraburkholderia sp. Ac-20336]|uniref:enoyl-CoA hydratase/isomerase family protein n=1 Tax=Burkholderiaceae TaxID=119060 RepID=UPI00141F24A7|nr:MULTISPECIES: enoyl-CoA hydratase/isomerase family protein [Burkholderiaceae]MBN3803375.1 enoyl-CoA hydratase/isomerase family protein [Paraburkholderia sp. Ac-20336]MBN3850564.1 enoyl-CoA hydratase/isomerase family protein [Paraburkholderia sp. Ac-20342]NIF51781.1 enoyl-CoA hydratase/isomerase family protein [Burkholderia sp. Ax-1724]